MSTYVETNRYIEYKGLQCLRTSELPKLPCPFGGCTTGSRCVSWGSGVVPPWFSFQQSSSSAKFRRVKKDTDLEYSMSNDRIHMVPNHETSTGTKYHIFTQNQALQCLQGRRIILTGDSMLRQTFFRLIFWLRGFPTTVEHYFHNHAEYTLYKNGSDELHVGDISQSWPERSADGEAGGVFRLLFTWDPEIKDTNTTEKFHPSTTTHNKKRDTEVVVSVGTYDMDVIVPGYSYHFKTILEEKLSRKAIDFANLTRERESTNHPVAVYWYMAPVLKDWAQLEYRNAALRAMIQRLNVNGIGAMKSKSMFVLPSDFFAATGNFQRNSINHTDGKNATVKDLHYQCSYLSHWPFDPLRNDRVKTPVDGDCRDLFNYNLIQVLLNSLCEERVEQVEALLFAIFQYELEQSIDSNDFTFIEEWASDDMLNQHFSDPFIQDKIAKFPRIAASGPEVRS
ncbi:UNVERIFIED_CONTAM: hypothetical protein HDU68_007856 [Siphonaria sp. JEL0065]|nr:hypothetical protein HDU68_007856 [Siphonaria sp. JEL0065]